MKTLCWKGWLGVAVLAAMLMVLPFSGTSRADKMPMKSGPVVTHAPHAKVIAVAFYADWCPLCKQMMPAQMQMMKWLKTEKKSVSMVKFDFSNNSTIAASAKLADQEGLSKVYKNHKGETGYVLLLNANNHLLISTIDHTDTVSQMEAKINNAIAAVKISAQK